MFFTSPILCPATRAHARARAGAAPQPAAPAAPAALDAPDAAPLAP